MPAAEGGKFSPGAGGSAGGASSEPAAEGGKFSPGAGGSAGGASSEPAAEGGKFSPGAGGSAGGASSEPAAEGGKFSPGAGGSAGGASSEEDGLAPALLELQRLTERLRRECPWDREQTAATIVPHTVEESYEVADAALAGDDEKLLDELGDLLFQVYFLALLLEERGAGDLAQVARGVHEKLVRRHPHVFGDVEARTAERVRSNWERIKREQEGREGIFHDVGEGLPGLLYARKIQVRAKSVGFEYPDLAGALADLTDELRELKEEPSGDELGDVLFAAVNVARRLEVDPELEVRRAAQRFRRRVEVAEQLAQKAGENWSELPLDRQDAYFDQAKETE